MVDLPAGPSRLRFLGVADGILPETATLQGLPAPIREMNFDYDLLSPASLIAASVGREVEVVRTARKSGAETRERAILRAGPDGVLLDFGGRVEAPRCGGEAERLVFAHAPPGLADRPTLSVLLDAPAAGRYAVKLGYLATGLTWSAHYVGRIAEDGASLALTGWITLANDGAVGFADAPTAVVAGNLARVWSRLPRGGAPQLLASCWGPQTTHSGWASPPGAYVLVQGQRVGADRMMAFAAALPPPPPPASIRAIESELGDYKLYTLAEPTTVAARQTKEVAFLDQPGVRFETVYSRTLTNEGAPEGPAPAAVVLRFDNTPARGLGRPLPAGELQLRRASGGQGLLVGSGALRRDIPVGEAFDVEAGAASDVTITTRGQGDAGQGRRVIDVVAVNAKPRPVVVEIRHDRGGATGFAVLSESAPHALEAGDPVWRLEVPANGAARLDYAVTHAPR